MDSFFGIGLPELIVILLLAGLLMGPQGIRKVARNLGRFIAQVQGLSREFSRQLNAELDAMDKGEMRDAFEEVKSLRQQLTELQREVRSLPRELSQESQQALEEGERVLSGKQNGAAVKSERPPAGLPKPIRVPDDPEV